MNKTQKLILIAVIAIIAGALLLMAAVFALGGPVRIIDRLLDHFHGSSQVTSVQTTEELPELDGRALLPGDRLQLDEFSEIALEGLVCDVEICSSFDGDFSINLDGVSYDPAQSGQYLLICLGKDDARYTVSLQDGKLTIRGEGLDSKLSVSRLRDLIVNGDRRLVLLVPEDWQGRLTARSAAGDIDVTNVALSGADIVLSAGDVDLDKVAASGDLYFDLAAGDLDLTNVACSQLELDVDLGDVDLDDIACGDLQLTANAGDLDLDKVACGDLNISLNAGELDADNVACGELTVKVDAGNVDLNDLEPAAADINCRLGAVTVYLRGSARDYAADCQVRLGECQVEDRGSGDRPIRVSVDMGSIVLNYGK